MWSLRSLSRLNILLSRPENWLLKNVAVWVSVTVSGSFNPTSAKPSPLLRTSSLCFLPFHFKEVAEEAGASAAVAITSAGISLAIMSFFPFLFLLASSFQSLLLLEVLVDSKTSTGILGNLTFFLWVLCWNLKAVAPFSGTKTLNLYHFNLFLTPIIN